jgi:3-hydroxyisobutyrate dehydrogenase
MRIGFIGLGIMGAGMAPNLQKAGHQLLVSDIRHDAAAPHLANGAEWAATPRDVAAGSEIVFTSLPGPPEMEAVALGENGLLAGMKPGGVYFDLSTNAPSMVRKVEAAFAERGAAMLDAPVSGGPQGAKSGRLAIWVGGDQAVFDRCKPVLDAIGDAARYVGPIGAGSVAKLVHNCAGYIVTVGMAEVFTMGVKAGVDPLAIWEAVRMGAIGRRGGFDGLVDVSLATALGKEIGVPMRLANMTLEEMTEALGRGWAGRDSRVVMKLQEERAGVTIAVEPERLRAALARNS